MDDLPSTVFTGHRLALMAHWICGYPSLGESADIMLKMAGKADILEIQIPFTDPLADGKTIMQAGQAALDKGVTPGDCFRLIRRIRGEIPIPVILMTYCNIPHRMGLEPFIRKAAGCGASGLIIPDLPFGEAMRWGYYEAMEKNRLLPVHVVSPGIAPTRARTIATLSGGFLYATLKVGITGAFERDEEISRTFLTSLRDWVDPLPVVAGFGLCSIRQIEQIRGLARGVVSGSHLIDTYKLGGTGAMIRRLGDLKKACQ